MQNSSQRTSSRWIDEEVYRSKVLALQPFHSESDAEEDLRRDARDLGLELDQKPSEEKTAASSMSATTIASEYNPASIISQSTAPTSCASSDRRPSTSLSGRSARCASNYEMPAIVTEMERKRHSGFKSGLRKMANFRKRRTSGSSTPSMISVKSQTTGTTADGSSRSPPKGAASIKSGDSGSSHDTPTTQETFATGMVMDPQALYRSMECQQLLSIRTRQLEEKRRFLEYQTRLIKQLLVERDMQKSAKREAYIKQIAELQTKVCTSGNRHLESGY